ERFTQDDLARWRDTPTAPDDDAPYAARIEIDLGELTPQVAGPDTVQAGTPLAAIAGRTIPVHKAYLLSCVNGRDEDLAAAAELLEGKQVAEGVTLYVAAASREIENRAKESGVWATLEHAGAHFLAPGCGPCIGLGEGLLQAGEVGISATNRNFKGRMGSRDAACYLASPRIVAASALAGTITGSGNWPDRLPARHLTVADPAVTSPDGDDETITLLPGFPEKLEGRLVYLPPDNLNTDGIYSKDYTYREDITRDEMARVVMENYDPQFSARTQGGDILVGGFNFGTGSSREQAATALQAKEIALVIAGSFSQTYLRNAFNNGFFCLALPDLVNHLRVHFADDIAAGTPTLIPGDLLHLDLAAGLLTLGDKTFRFAPLGIVPQRLIIAGGVENQVRQRLGL
ncbi:MAG: homoaconitase, partial [Deltaproteobacteria bacterium]|nr:homoaconitase [Deltaproteobacteria bacterium]